MHGGFSRPPERMYCAGMEVRPADPTVIRALAEALQVRGATLADAVLVDVSPSRQNTHGWPVHIVGAHLDVPGFPGAHRATWAVGEGPGWGPIFALNDAARAYSSWGEAAQPGSRAEAMVQRIATCPEAVAAEATAQ